MSKASAWAPVSFHAPVDVRPDPENEVRLLARDRAGGSYASTNGGQTWETLVRPVRLEWLEPVLASFSAILPKVAHRAPASIGWEEWKAIWAETFPETEN